VGTMAVRRAAHGGACLCVGGGGLKKKHDVCGRAKLLEVVVG
jgi:hypothetical protein